MSNESNQPKSLITPDGGKDELNKATPALDYAVFCIPTFDSDGIHRKAKAEAELVTLREKEDSWETFLRQRNRYQGFTPEKDSEPLCRIRDALNLTHWLCESVDNESDGPEDEEVKQAQAEYATLRAEADKWRAFEAERQAQEIKDHEFYDRVMKRWMDTVRTRKDDDDDDDDLG